MHFGVHKILRTEYRTWVGGFGFWTTEIPCISAYILLEFQNATRSYRNVYVTSRHDSDAILSKFWILWNAVNFRVVKHTILAILWVQDGTILECMSYFGVHDWSARALQTKCCEVHKLECIECTLECTKSYELSTSLELEELNSGTQNYQVYPHLFW